MRDSNVELSAADETIHSNGGKVKKERRAWKNNYIRRYFICFMLFHDPKRLTTLLRADGTLKLIGEKDDTKLTPSLVTHRRESGASNSTIVHWYL